MHRPRERQRGDNGAGDTHLCGCFVKRRLAVAVLQRRVSTMCQPRSYDKQQERVSQKNHGQDEQTDVMGTDSALHTSVWPQYAARCSAVAPPAVVRRFTSAPGSKAV